MKRSARCDRSVAARGQCDQRGFTHITHGGIARHASVAATRAQSAQRGFTLIELLVAIAILAVIAVLSWRGFSQIVHSRDTIVRSMADERVFSQLFDQMRIDARLAVSDDEAGEAAVSLSGNTLQIVRPFAAAPGSVPRLQVVRYRIANGRLIRYASPPLGNLGTLRRALHGGEDENWSAVPLIGGIGAINARLYVPKTGWTLDMKVVRAAIAANNDALKMPPASNAPLPRAVTGLEVSIGATSLQRPIERVFLVGE